ncbi:hypothetical protein B296_00029812 [Ensete ventricosum]|uniref:Uncharacterized protein n=1 Tax=Ensete ventricosum TaxID=4639 RepID=A0A426Z3H2_ENSVE|nr:hypothetical protein B296_00029812 [Ensete ventricosum]
MASLTKVYISTAHDCTTPRQSNKNNGLILFVPKATAVELTLRCFNAWHDSLEKEMSFAYGLTPLSRATLADMNTAPQLPRGRPFHSMVEDTGVTDETIVVGRTQLRHGSFSTIMSNSYRQAVEI